MAVRLRRIGLFHSASADGLLQTVIKCGVLIVHHFERGGSLKVTGGALGVVIDARGRPLRLPSDPGRRGELYRKWLWMLGG